MDKNSFQYLSEYISFGKKIENFAMAWITVISIKAATLEDGDISIESVFQ